LASSPPPKGSASKRCGSTTAGGCWRCRNGRARGYREYSEADRWRLAFIRRARQLGFSLGEIGDLLGPAEARSTGDIVRAAEARLEAINRQLGELALLRCRLRRLVQVCEHGNGDDCLALRLEPELALRLEPETAP